ncbi:MAG: 3-deoxy-7-phosphoheptulonate synthase [Lentisphaeria bacterium]|jgi:3-deoxy-7-phosphoheptulonate synthase
MIHTDNLNIESFAPLSPPATIKAELPLTDKAADTVVTARAALENILAGRDPRLAIMVGPCSIHSRQEALAYAARLRPLAQELADQMLLVMRVYFEKPRTVLGWKGLLYDPALSGSCDLEAGLRLARHILLEINELGMPAATEILEPVIPQYITDLIAWGAIGARTTESQTHRQMASGLSMPVGFKNSTDGSVRNAIDAIRAAQSPHTFVGITGEGTVAAFRTRGNPFGHLILRGGTTGPNYTSEHLAFCRELMRKSGLVPTIVVDCSHANSGRNPLRQRDALLDVIRQHLDGDTSLKGAMLESNLETGRQEIPDDPARLRPGLSVTDPCLGWTETEALLREAAALLRRA